jgi:hypothetical protein
MIFLAAVLASGQVLPGIDRAWLAEQVRLEALSSVRPKRPIKSAPPVPTAHLKIDRNPASYANTIGM